MDFKKEIDDLIAKYKKTLKDISIDSDAAETKTKDRNIYMTHSSISACSFDDVADYYTMQLHLQYTPASVDALCYFREIYFFIEFKNGKIDTPKKAFQIAKKVYDSILILDYFTQCGTNYIRNNFEFVLVYNEDIPNNSIENLKKISIFSEEKPSSIDKIKKATAKLAKEEFVFFGFNFFKKHCFKNVHTYNKKEFEDFLKSHT